MILTLDAKTEQRIPREIDLGRASDPAEVINRALDLLEAGESWSEQEKSELEAHLAESVAQAARGEVYTPDEAAGILDERIAQRAG